jgi:hypothetical protein
MSDTDKAGARTRYCRDCRFITLPAPGAFDLATCAHPMAATLPPDHLVSGQGERRQLYCVSMRSGSKCDTDGKLWERRQ